MNDFEFRGKGLNTGKWVYGDLHTSPIRGHYNIHNVTVVDFDEVDPETVGQYTGIKDKNGVKIFEGDVVKMYNSPYMRKPGFGKIIRLYGGLWFNYIIPIHNPDNKRTAITGLLAFLQTPVEVLGNIYDRPEILTEASNGR